MTYRNLELTERQWQDQVLKAAQILGWFHYHTYSSKLSTEGFPDLVLVKHPRMIFAELKNQKGEPTLAQDLWLAELRLCPGVETYLWRPDDWPEVERVLKGEQAA